MEKLDVSSWVSFNAEVAKTGQVTVKIWQRILGLCKSEFELCSTSMLPSAQN